MSDNILLLGASGYMGSAFVAQTCPRERELVRVVKHAIPDHKFLWSCLRDSKARVVINCSAFIGQPSVDKNKEHPKETIETNILMPAMLAQVCDAFQVPLIHLSTACLYDEEKQYEETETPLRGFDGYCGFYVGTKLLAESQVQQYERHYILRLRLPFDNVSSPRNYLNKMMAYPRIFDHVNSLTHRGDFAKSAIQLWQSRAPFGTYHVACEGQISNRDVISKLMKKGLLTEKPEFIPGNCTGCRLSTKKLAEAGVKLRSVEEAVDEAIENFKI